jgi:hypothetical protein
MKYLYLLLLWLWGCHIIYAQTPFIKEKRDYVWLMGYRSNPNTALVGGTRIDFNFSPPALSYEYRELNFDVTNASICDAEGNLLFYTNGIEVHDNQDLQIENGWGLNPDPYTEVWADRGYYLSQGVLFLPVPDSLSRFFLVHSEVTTFPEGINGGYRVGHRLYLSKIEEGDSALGLSQVSIKNHILIADTIDFGKVTAVRHANGKDWWMVQQEYFSNHYYTLLATSDSIKLIGLQSVGEASPSGLGQAVFSPDGKKYAKLDLHYIGQDQYLNIYDFDRCAGDLYNPIQLTYRDTAFSGGVAISPNSRFLYVSSYRYIYQYDLEAADIEASREVVAVYDGGLAPPPFEVPTRFFLCQLAPDDKIYISSTNTVPLLHVIHNPNAKGAACEVEQRGLALPTFNAFGIPNSPYYGLGPEDGSPCDTLGLDHHPKAAFRYRASEAEPGHFGFWDYSLFFPTHWEWDFGDGSAGSTEQDPEHAYAQGGTYKVCLTVSNEHASDTYCEWVEVDLPSSSQAAPPPPALKLYPNPAHDYLSVELPFRLPQGGRWHLRDLQGRPLRSGALPLGQPLLMLDLAGLPGGVYVFELALPDGRRLVEKVVVVR